MKWSAAALAALAVFVSFGTGAGHLPGEGPEAVVLHVDIREDQVVLNHSYDEQVVTLAGSVLVDLVYIVTVRVALSVSTDLGWIASVVPEDMTFVSSVTQFFNATVKVPAGTFNRSAILTVRGDATIPPGLPEGMDTDTANVTVRGGQDGGNGSGPPPVVPRGRPAPTGVFVPPVQLIMGAATVGAIAFTAFMLWYWNVAPARRTGKQKRGR